MRDEARDVPAGYEPPPAFSTAALQHTAVKLTWDAEPAERRRALSKRVTAEQLRDDDFKVWGRPGLWGRFSKCSVKNPAKAPPHHIMILVAKRQRLSLCNPQMLLGLRA